MFNTSMALTTADVEAPVPEHPNLYRCPDCQASDAAEFCETCNDKGWLAMKPTVKSRVSAVLRAVFG